MRSRTRASTKPAHFRSVESVWTDDVGSVVVIGRGLCGRWEVGYEVEPEQRGAGLGRRLVARGTRTRPRGRAAVGPGRAGKRRVDAVDARGRVRPGRRRDALRAESVTSPPMTDLVLTERHDGGVALLRLNRPPMNPLSIALLDALARRRARARRAMPA